MNHCAPCPGELDVFTYVLLLLWWEGTPQRRWAEGPMTGPGSRWWGASSSLGLALLPVSPIRPPAAGSACFCPAGPFRRRLPAHGNTEHWLIQHRAHFSSTAGRFSFLDVALGKRITSHGRSSAHFDGPWETETRRCWPQFCASTYHPQNHSYPRVIYYPQRHVTAAPCCTETLKARHVAISIIH